MKTRNLTRIGFSRSLKGAFLAILGAAIVAAIAVAIIWPLWYLATSFTAIYTVLALAAIVAVIAVVAIGRMRVRKAEKETVIAIPLSESARVADPPRPVSGASEDAV